MKRRGKLRNETTTEEKRERDRWKLFTKGNIDIIEVILLDSKLTPWIYRFLFYKVILVLFISSKI